MVGAVELLIEIQKRIAHFFLQSGNLRVESTLGAIPRTVEFLGTVIREVTKTPIQLFLLRELEKRLRVKHRIHITAHLRCSAIPRNRNGNIPMIQLTRMGSPSLLRVDAVQQQDDQLAAETLGTAGVRSPQAYYGSTSKDQGGSMHSHSRSQGVGRRSSTGSLTIGHECPEEGQHWSRSISEFPIQIEAPIKIILRRLRDRGLISRRRPWPIHVALYVSDGDIVNWSAGIAISPLSYYRCRDNLYQVRTIDQIIRWSAIFTLAHKHKSSARNIIECS